VISALIRRPLIALSKWYNFHLIDAVYAPILRYFDVFDRFCELNTFTYLVNVPRWRSKLTNRNSVQQAVSPHYPELLIKFLVNRDSYMSQLIDKA
jgi:glutathione S-transferase